MRQKRKIRIKGVNDASESLFNELFPFHSVEIIENPETTEVATSTTENANTNQGCKNIEDSKNVRPKRVIKRISRFGNNLYDT